MCGFVAMAGRAVDSTLAQRALGRLTHRGPDHGQSWCSEAQGVWLGHRRLSIVDLSAAGNQPMANEDASLQLVANGEIYNAPALRQILEGQGHRFHSSSDCEVILHAYEAWGPACLDRLEGMFAFVLWDGVRQRMFAARDRLGIKPICFMVNEQGITLASETSALEEIMGGARQLDAMGLAYIMTLGYLPAPWSVWRGVEKLEAGYYLLWDQQNGLSRQCYWEPPRALDNPVPAAQLQEVWQGLFEGVLEQHLLADVPIGLFLSAGLDSTSLALGLKRLGRPLEAFSLGFSGHPRSEAALAEVTAWRLGFPFHEVPLTIKEVIPLMRTMATMVDEPQATGGFPTTYSLSSAVAQRFKVALAGDGGDEIFGGYTWYRDLHPLPTGTAWLKRQVLRPLSGRATTPAIRNAAANNFAWSSPLHRHAWRVFSRFLPEEVAALLSPMGIRFDEEAMLAPLQRYFEPRLPLQRALQRVDLMTYCADCNLAKVDRASMACSLEVRVPFLDHRLVQWGISLPMEGLPENPSKPLLRGYLAGQVPDSILNHPKQGFSLQGLDEAFDWEQALVIIERGVWVREGYWSGIWRNLLAPGVPFRTSRIWTLLALTMWGEARLP